MSFKTWLGLLLCNLIWSAHPLMGKLVLQDFDPVMAAELRYGSALLAFLLFAILTVGIGNDRASSFWLRGKPRDLGLVILLGSLTFCLSPILLMFGLGKTQATDNALIIAMEPLMTVILAWLFLGEEVTAAAAAAFAIALLGFALLAGKPDLHSIGNLVILASLAGEASYSTLGRKLIRDHKPQAIFGIALAAGVAGLAGASWFSASPLGWNSAHWSWPSALAILWLGPMGTTLCYFYWISLLGDAQISVASMALTLFVQPIFGSLWGYYFLGERLSPLQLAGGMLILAAVMFHFYAVSRKLSRF